MCSGWAGGWVGGGLLKGVLKAYLFRAMHVQGGGMSRHFADMKRCRAQMLVVVLARVHGDM